MAVERAVESLVQDEGRFGCRSPLERDVTWPFLGRMRASYHPRVHLSMILVELVFSRPAFLATSSSAQHSASRTFYVAGLLGASTSLVVLRLRYLLLHIHLELARSSDVAVASEVS